MSNKIIALILFGCFVFAMIGCSIPRRVVNYTSALISSIVDVCNKKLEIVTAGPIDISKPGNLFSVKMSGEYTPFFLFPITKVEIANFDGEIVSREEFDIQKEIPPAYSYKYQPLPKTEKDLNPAIGWPKGLVLEVQIKDSYGVSIQTIKMSESVIREQNQNFRQVRMVKYLYKFIPECVSKYLEIEKYSGCFCAYFEHTVRLHDSTEYTIDVRVLEPAKNNKDMFLMYYYESSSS